MLQKIENGMIYVIAKSDQEATIRAWRMMKKDKEKGYWYAPISKELLLNLQNRWGLIPPAKKLLEEMQEIQDAVDAERVKPDKDVSPMCRFPVKAKLYTHQIRAANMALMTFGAIPPGGGS